jgi:predicted O-linked N-acetylglucosamine transferase (SPINDLY family)
MFNWLKNKSIPSFQVKQAVTEPVAELCATTPVSVDKSIAYKSLGDKCFGEGKLEEAIASYQLAIKLNPSFAEAYNNLGNAYREQGLPAVAEQSLKQAIQIKPDLVNAYCNLGSLLLERGKHKDAAIYLNKALELRPDVEVIYRDLVFALVQAGKFADAKQVVTKGLALNPNSADLLAFLGNIHLQQNEFDLAVACYQQALNIQPGAVEVNINLGKIYIGQGRLQDAVDCYRQALALKNDYAELHFELGGLLYKLKKLDEAMITFQKVLTLKPEFAEAYIYLGIILNDIGKVDEALTYYHKSISLNSNLIEAYVNIGGILKNQGKPDEALATYRHALKINPESPEIYLNLGVIFQSLGDFNQAVAYYKKSLDLKPDFAEANNKLGNAFLEQNLIAEAYACYSKAIKMNPNFADAYYNLGALLILQRKNSEGLEYLQKSLNINPDHNTARTLVMHLMQHMCNWTDLASIAQTVRHAVINEPTTEKNIFPPFAFLAIPGATAKEQKQCALRWAHNEYSSLISLRKKLDFKCKRSPNSKITIAYISMDLRNHPVSYLMAEVFKLHDRNRFNVIAYAYDNDKKSAMRERLESSFDSFVDIRNYTHEQAAKKIHADHVDILIDLTGHTQNNRTGILALRPAPVQVNYLGYPGTMGADFYDYLIADRFIIPEEHKPHYTETIVWMPDCFQANDRSRPRPAPPTRSELGLANDAVVFCCFNQTYKITQEMFDVWCRLLIAVPDSIIWITASNPQSEINLRNEAEARGIAGERLVMAPLLSREAHLARMQCADLFLDTLPYNAGTTCSDALWMGLPVITCAGDSFVSRMAGSLLATIGTPELITYNLEDYYRLALDLATDRKKLEAIRNKIIANRDTSPLFDTERFTRNLENAYIRMMDIHINKSIYPH